MGFFDFFRNKYVISDPDQYDKVEREVTVLTRDSVATVRTHGRKYASAVMRTIAYIDEKTGRLVEDYTVLKWDMTNAEAMSPAKKHGLKKETCYRLRVRPSLACTSHWGAEIPAGRSLFVTKVLKRDCEDARLNEVFAEYCRPRTLELVGAEFRFIRESDWYLGDVQWNGEECGVILHTDDGKFACADTAAAAFEKIYASCTEWDKKAREYAAKEMTENANDWADQGDEENHIITRAEFARRIGTPNISVFNDGSFEFVYEDDEMFGGHLVVVSGTLDEGFSEVNLEG